MPSPYPAPDPDLTLESTRVTKLKTLALRVRQPQYQIAALAGIHPSVFSMYVLGQKPILAKHLVALCELFNVEPEDVLGWEDE